MENKNSTSPPKFASQFLRWFCPDDLYEGIEGDLNEAFTDELNEGKGRANLRFVIRVVRFFQPAIIFRNKIKIHFMKSTLLNN